MIIALISSIKLFASSSRGCAKNKYGINEVGQCFHNSAKLAYCLRCLLVTAKHIKGIYLLLVFYNRSYKAEIIMLLLIHRTILSISNKIRVIWSEWYGGMFRTYMCFIFEINNPC